MRNRLLTLAVALLSSAAPAVTPGQTQYRADFPAARHQFLRGEVRQAAYTVMLASAHVREEVGRCKDGGMGDRLLAAEGRLDRLVAQLRAGEVTSVSTLDATFAAADLVLAEHHVRLAAWGWANQRVSSPAEIGHGLDRAAFHYVRGMQEEGRTLDAPTQYVVDDAQRVARQIADAERLPAETGAVIAALSRVITPAQIAERSPRGTR
jgi:hypothetical protein